MNTPKKPKCVDFIIAAIKVMRVRSPNIKPATAWSGLPMSDVVKVALDCYSPKAISRAFERLLEQNIIIAIGRSTEYREGDFILAKLPPKSHLAFVKGGRLWMLGEKGEALGPQKPYDYKKEREHPLELHDENFRDKRFQWFPRLYLAADKLPLNVTRLLEKPKERAEPKKVIKKKSHARRIPRTTAESIIKAMH